MARRLILMRESIVFCVLHAGAGRGVDGVAETVVAAPEADLIYFTNKIY